MERGRTGSMGVVGTGDVRHDDTVRRGHTRGAVQYRHSVRLRDTTPRTIDSAIDAAARACALRELANPPHERTEANARPRRGANHASALHALWFNADPGDAPMLARVLNENVDEYLQRVPTGAEPVLRGEPAHPALIEALASWRSAAQPTRTSNLRICVRRAGRRDHACYRRSLCRGSRIPLHSKALTTGCQGWSYRKGPASNVNLTSCVS